MKSEKYIRNIESPSQYGKNSLDMRQEDWSLTDAEKLKGTRNKGRSRERSQLVIQMIQGKEGN